MARAVSTPWPMTPRSVFFSDVASPPTLTSAVKDGRIRRVGVGLYTADLVSSAEAIVLENLWRVVAHYCPDAVIVDRSAAAGGRVDGGVVTLSTDARATSLSLPGLEILVRPLERATDDLPWSNGLYVSSPARTLVDNLADSRRRATTARTLNQGEIGDWLARKSLAWDPSRMDRLRADARRRAAEGGHLEREGAIDRLFDELQGVRQPRASSGRLLIAARSGVAWDEARLSLFDEVAGQLAGPKALAGVPEHLDPPEAEGDAEFAFYEAYFSNYIEGTEFDVEEAREIVETNTPPAQRSADGHDILGTFRCVADPVGRAVAPDDPDQLVQVAMQRHGALMVGRPDMGPGTWKVKPNRAGSVEFVHPDLVEGTLSRGLADARHVAPGFPRAVYVMFVMAEVHPFADGNGRTARMMMNAELSAVGSCRIIVPTILRNEYIGSLRRVTNHRDVGALVRVLSHSWKWSSAIPWSDRAAVQGQMVATNALIDSNEAAAGQLQLEIP